MKFKNYVFYVISIILLIIYVSLDFLPDFSLSELGRLFFLCGSCIFLYFGGLVLSKKNKNNNAMKVNLWIFFVLYIILLCTLTLFDSTWGRQGFSFVNKYGLSLNDYISNCVNLIPFKTIVNYIGEFNSLLGTKTIMLNLFGNLCAFMPMAFFLPLLFKKENKFKKFFITMTIIIFSIEIVQLITCSGRFDIDDYILNILGTIMMFYYLKIESVNKIVKKVFLLENNKISKKDIKFFIISVLVVIFLLGIITTIANTLYKRNLYNHERLFNPSIKFEDESKECVKENDLFYEDEFYKYFFSCKKSDKFFIIINNEDKFLLKDILGNNTTDYNLYIDKVLERLDYYKYEYKKVDKYESIEYNYNLSNVSPNLLIEVLDNNIIEAKSDNWILTDDSTFKTKVFLKPKQDGTTNIKIKLMENGSKEIINDDSYTIIVDSDKNVRYKKIN